MGNEDTLEQKLAQRLLSLRQGRGWSLDDLATASGLSRATLSRIERQDTSPTASQLGQICAAFGTTMSRLLGGLEGELEPYVPRVHQLIWIDPGTGFRRRQVSPPSAALRNEIIEGELPVGAVIAYEAPPVMGLEQQIWLMSGRLEFTDQEAVYILEAGDCLRLHLLGRTRFESLGPEPAHYIVVLSTQV